MNLLATLLCVFLIIPFIFLIAYVFVMMGKQRKITEFKLGNLLDRPGDAEVIRLEELICNIMKGSKGYIRLATLFVSLHYLLNTWSISFGLLNLIVLGYLEVEPSEKATFIMLYTIISVISNVVDIWIDTKGKSRLYNQKWFSTSHITRIFLADTAKIKSWDEMCARVMQYEKDIYEDTKDIDFM